MARNMKQVTPDDVRKWAVETDWRDEYDREVATRGRLSTKLVNDYNNANRRYGREYVGGPPGPRPRTTDVARQDSGSRQPAKTEKATPQPATRQRARAEDEDEAPIQVASERIQASGEGDQTALMVQDVIAALAAAGNSRKGNGRGEPTLVTTTVSAHKLMYI